MPDKHACLGVFVSEQAVQKHTKLECKCHGVSGACSIRTCWRAMLDFREVGHFLKKKYIAAVEVMSNQVNKTIHSYISAQVHNEVLIAPFDETVEVPSLPIWSENSRFFLT